MKTIHIVLGGAASIALLLVALPARGKALAEAPTDLVEPAGGSAAATPGSSVQAQKSATSQQLDAQGMRRAELQWHRDPFASLVVPEAAEPDISKTAAHRAPDVAPKSEPEAPVKVVEAVVPQLSGISRQGSTHWAIIDHEIVREGDVLPTGHRVAKIDARAVTLALGSQKLTLLLGAGR